MTKFVCNECGGENLMEQVWLSMNNTTGKTADDVVCQVESTETGVWCEDCDKWVYVEEVSDDCVG